MPLVPRSLTIRARLVPAPQAPLDRLFDPLVDDLVHDGPLAHERFPTRWKDTNALRELADAKRAPLAPALVQELTDYHRRLGAPPASLAALECLARGEAVCSVAGQQPAPLGGPLYSLHKTASAVALAASIESRTGAPCVPLFWMHGEDSDFAEVRTATIGDRTLALHELSLPQSTHREGEMIGGMPVPPLAELNERGLALWEGLPGVPDAAALLRGATARARDQGEAYSALMLALFGDRGLVVIDPRLASFRAEARRVIDRYLPHAETLSEAVRRAGDLLEARVQKRPLADSALDSFVFAIEQGGRRKVLVSEARALRDGVLSPNVALRPIVQDGVFPTVAMSCGAAEISYLAQLREVFERVGVRPACPVPRLSATWLPPAAIELLETSKAEPWELVAGADQVLRRLAEREVPPEIAAELEQARAAANSALERFATSSERIDGSLPQLVESARGKIDFQYARLLEGLTSKMRHRLERRHPEWWRLRYYLLPGDRLQERRLASLEVTAYRGRDAAAELCELAREHAERLAASVHEHLLLEL